MAKAHILSPGARLARPVLSRDHDFGVLPMSPGSHNIDVHLWRPVATSVEELTANFIGGSPHLRNGSIDRFRLKSESLGVVHISVSLRWTSNFQVGF
jgi:B9 domain-containing protein 2